MRISPTDHNDVGDDLELKKFKVDYFQNQHVIVLA
jgi:hypothetical protein